MPVEITANRKTPILLWSCRY